MPNNAHKIKVIAKDVYRSLGSGYSEEVYDRAMQVWLRLAKIKYENQKVVELTFKDHHVGEGWARFNSAYVSDTNGAERMGAFD